MSLVVYDQDIDRYMTSEISQLLHALLKAKERKHPWDVVDLCVEAFRQKFPRHYKSYVIRLQEVKASQKKTWVGTREFSGVSKDKHNDAYLAHTIDFPAWIMSLIRKIYDTNELKMDKEFFREFGKRYPEFAIMKPETR